MSRAKAMLSYWNRFGPPVPVAIRIVGHTLGIDWKIGSPQPEADTRPALSIAETLALAPKPLE